mmetsp:Transcript_310/g.609  ORF Transcript_310/g.609 Transcript_310/m.609 type:complete len:174 (+) Transcript_310:27-548(+)
MLGKIALGVLALKNTCLIGPGAGFSVSWTYGADSTDICFSASNQTDSSYIGLGFSAQPHNAMNASDIVVGFTGTVKALFSDSSTGYPDGTPALKISNGKFSYKDGTSTTCFTRPTAGGTTPLTSSGYVIWANGPVASGDISYHSPDAPDPTGKSQTHRSDETPVIDWVNGSCK